MARKINYLPDLAPNEGARALREILLRRSPEHVATHVLRGFTTRQTILQWARGAVPVVSTRPVLERELGIDVAAWLRKLAAAPTNADQRRPTPTNADHQRVAEERAAVEGV